jgi:hypothetical protein
MSEEDYKIAYENVMIANKMLEQENKQLKEKIDILLEDNNQLEEIRIKAIDFLHNNTMIGHCKEHFELLEILGDKENDE